MGSIGASGRLSTRQLRKSGGIPPVTVRTPLPSCLAGICLLVSWWGPPRPPSSCPLKVGAPGLPPLSLHDPRQSDPPFCLDVQQLFQTQYTELLTFPSVSPSSGGGNSKLWGQRCLLQHPPLLGQLCLPGVSGISALPFAPQLPPQRKPPNSVTWVRLVSKGPPWTPAAALPPPSVINVSGKDPVKPTSFPATLLMLPLPGSSPQGGAGLCALPSSRPRALLSGQGRGRLLLRLSAAPCRAARLGPWAGAVPPGALACGWLFRTSGNCGSDILDTAFWGSALVSVFVLEGQPTEWRVRWPF